MAPLPDLLIAEMTATDGTTALPPRLSLTIQNRGSADTGPGDSFDVHVFADLGRPPVPTDNQFVGHFVVPRLAAGASYTILGGLFPGSLAAGAHTLWALADGHDTVRESDEANNSDSVPVAVSAAPTVTATATPAPTAPPRPVAITFDDLPGQDRYLDGEYPAGVVDWGTGTWRLVGAQGQVTSKGITLGERSSRAGGFRFVVPRRLVSLRAYARIGGSSTVSLSCAGQPTTTATVPAGQTVTIATGWTGTCSTVTIDLSDGWRTHLDDLVYDAGP